MADDSTLVGDNELYRYTDMFKLKKIIIEKKIKLSPQNSPGIPE